MTYNTHACVGTDGRLDLARVAAELRPDLLALQEVDVARERSGGVDQAEEIARHLGMKAHFTCAFENEGGRYGIALIAANELYIESEGCLPTHGDEVRAAQWARVEVDQVHVDVVHTHLSVRLRDRTAQLAALFGADWLECRLADPYLIVCGDLNALPCSAVYRALSRKLHDVQRLHNGRRRATWPSRWPIARVDHIFVSRGLRVRDCCVARSPLARRASDHLPLVAEVVPVQGLP
jgi:endonuclease/exonuclease/phosphatase family metal-dependent hydrolase